MAPDTVIEASRILNLTPRELVFNAETEFEVRVAPSPEFVPIELPPVAIFTARVVPSLEAPTVELAMAADARARRAPPILGIETAIAALRWPAAILERLAAQNAALFVEPTRGIATAMFLRSVFPGSTAYVGHGECGQNEGGGAGDARVASEWQNVARIERLS